MLLYRALTNIFLCIFLILQYIVFTTLCNALNKLSYITKNKQIMFGQKTELMQSE